MEHAHHPDVVWILSSHACAHCFGRILQHQVSGEVRCADCGASAAAEPGKAHPSICCCAAMVGKKPVGIRCMLNPRRRSAMPAVIVVAEAA